MEMSQTELTNINSASVFYCFCESDPCSARFIKTDQSVSSVFSVSVVMQDLREICQIKKSDNF